MFVTKFLYENGRHNGMSLYLHTAERNNFFRFPVQNPRKFPSVYSDIKVREAEF
jgi:hypothetical protein